jgi:hypothetical protein
MKTLKKYLNFKVIKDNMRKLKSLFKVLIDKLRSLNKLERAV